MEKVEKNEHRTEYIKTIIRAERGRCQTNSSRPRVPGSEPAQTRPQAPREEEDDRSVRDTKCTEHEPQNPQQRLARATQPHVERTARHTQGGAGPGCERGLTGENQPGNNIVTERRTKTTRRSQETQKKHLTKSNTLSRQDENIQSRTRRKLL